MEAYPDVDLVEAEGEAVDLDVRADHVEAAIRQPSGDGSPHTRTLTADHVILATGMELKQPAFATDVLGHESFIRHPYSTDGVRRLLAAPPDASVVIVGTVLSAYDSAALLLRQGHTGTIHLVSKSGATPRAYPEDHQHGVVQLSVPELLLKPFRNRAEFLARVQTEWEAACAAFEQAVSLEVGRLAARSRAERERLDELLGNHLRSHHRFNAVPTDGRCQLMRAAVNQAAVERLTDVSVTPRQLRRQLGIANDDDAESS